MRRIFSFGLLAAVLASPSATLAQSGADLESLLARAHAARPEPLRCNGTADVFGAEHGLELAFDGAGRFEIVLAGPLGTASGFDGVRAWKVDERAGVPYDLDLYLGDAFRAWMGVWVGDWCEASFGFEIELSQQGDEGIELTLHSPRSSYTATLLLDPRTLAPQKLSPKDWGPTDEVRFEGVVDGLARHVERIDPAGNVDVLVINSAESYSVENDPDAFGVHASPRNVSFDSTVDSELEVKRSPSGHLLVHPKVDGKDVGWFMFDSGAPVTLIDPRVAEELGLPEIGRTYVGGGGAEMSEATLRRGTSLELGPIRLEDPVFTTFSTINPNTVGVIGWDVLIHSVVEVDMGGGALSIHDRENYEFPAGEWRDMVLHMRHPHVTANFAGGHEGLFRIDTGAGHISVMFHTPTVRLLDLLANRETTAVQARGAGGPVQLRVGEIDWFEIAGHRTERPMALFCMDESGALADPNAFGNLGGGVLKPFVLVFDYQGKRVGFVRRHDPGDEH